MDHMLGQLRSMAPCGHIDCCSAARARAHLTKGCHIGLRRGSLRARQHLEGHLLCQRLTARVLANLILSGMPHLCAH